MAVSGCTMTASSSVVCQGAPVLDVQPRGACIAYISAKAVEFYSAAPDSSLLAMCQTLPSVHHRSLAWHPNGKSVVCAASACVLFYAIDGRSAMAVEPYASPSVVAACGSVSCIVADHSAVLVAGGGNAAAGNAALLSWEGDVIRLFDLT